MRGGHVTTDAVQGPADVGGDGEGLRILVVDDDPDLRALLGEFLADLGTVHAVPDAYQALAWIDAETVDVLVLDLLLPGANGVDLLERIRGRDRAIPTVVVSAIGPYDGLAQQARDAGATVVVGKPFDRRELTFSVTEALRQIREG